ncbi:fungal-specific transcription factor domain-containing protein [Dichotomocladium elegans]|nr:fungal-specific transcription factor domain-containing protein [Dichotomocladium elegans]
MFKNQTCAELAVYVEYHGAISVNLIGRAQYVPDPCKVQYSRMSGDVAKPPEVRPDLIEAYFYHIHPYFPILDRSAFEAQLQQQEVPTMLLYAVYALASHWHNPANDPVPGWSYYQAAFALMDIGLDAPRVSTVQALVLIIRYHEHVPRTGYLFRTRLYLDMVRRICLDLKLWRRQNNMSEDPGAELGVRTFWAVYGLDLSTSIEEGLHPFPLDNNDPVEFPNPRLYDGAQQHQRQNSIMFYYFWMCRIWYVQGKILHFLRIKYDKEAPSSDAEEEEDEMKQRTRLESALDAIVGNNPLDSQTYGSHSYYACRFLQIALHFTTILLYRPYIQSGSGIRTKCMQAAVEITNILSEITYTNGIDCLRHCPPRGIQQCIYYLSASITVFQLIPDSANGMAKAAKLIQTLAYASPEKCLWPSTTQGFEGFQQHQPVYHECPDNTHHHYYMPSATVVHTPLPSLAYAQHQPSSIIHQQQIQLPSHRVLDAMQNQ